MKRNVYLKVLVIALKQETICDSSTCDYFAIFQSTCIHHKNDGGRLDGIEDKKGKGCNDEASTNC